MCRDERYGLAPGYGGNEVAQTILIVDDEETVREVLRRLLTGEGYTVLEAETGERALTIARENPVDVTITDFKMPGMDGLALAKTLIEEDPDRPVLMMTAYSAVDNAREAVGIGVFEYYVKPFNVEDVLASIRRALEHRRLVLETREYQSDLERRVADRTRELQRTVLELEARDQLLRHLLLDQESGDCLSVALTLALNLCDCDCGALYMIDLEDQLQMRALAGFGEEDDHEPVENLPRLADEIMTDLKQVLKTREPTFNHSPGQNRQNLGIHSLLLVPIIKGESPIGILEVGKRRRDALVGKTEFEKLQGFFPYVVIAAADSKLQESIPEWEGNVEEVLKVAKEWSN